MAAVANNSLAQIRQDVETLQVAGFGNCQQAGRGQLAGGAAVAEANLAPLHTSAEGSFGAVVGWLDALLLQKSVQPPVVLEERRGKIPDFSVSTVQVGLCERETPFLDLHRTRQELLTIDLPATKLAP